MNFKIGSDICSVKRIEEAYDKFGERFLDKILTAGEKSYVLSNKKDILSRTAVRFAAKEAMSKVLGTGFRGLAFKEIEVVKLPSGAPAIQLHGRAVEIAQKRKLDSFEITLSHEREYAIAFVLGFENRSHSGD